MSRINFMDFAESISGNSDCIRRKVGAIIVKNEMIIAIGYNHQPEKCKKCNITGCIRIDACIPSGEQQNICRAIHAEQSALLFALKNKVDVIDSEMYITLQPCATCAKLIIESGITTIFYKEKYNDKLSLEMLKEAGVRLIYCG